MDLRRTKVLVSPVTVQGFNVDIMEDYRYLAHSDDEHRHPLQEGPEPSLFSKAAEVLQHLQACAQFFPMAASAIPFAMVCWGSELKVADANRSFRLICKASDVMGVKLDSF